MKPRLSEAARVRAILARDKRYDGIFYFAVKPTGVYCRPSCLSMRPIRSCLFFDTIDEAKFQGFRACKSCHPDRLKNNLSLEILDKIDTGAINSNGVHGLADALHISERHLRRIVQERTGFSPNRLNKEKRLNAAKQLIVQTKLPIIDVAFSVGFSSLRQFNDVFKSAFKTSPREMRKSAGLVIKEKPSNWIVLQLGAATLTN